MKRSSTPLDSRCAHCGTTIPYTETEGAVVYDRGRL